MRRRCRRSRDLCHRGPVRSRPTFAHWCAVHRHLRRQPHKIRVTGHLKIELFAYLQAGRILVFEHELAAVRSDACAVGARAVERASQPIRQRRIVGNQREAPWLGSRCTSGDQVHRSPVIVCESVERPTFQLAATIREQRADIVALDDDIACRRFGDDRLRFCRRFGQRR